jgi:hypothetical protein
MHLMPTAKALAISSIKYNSSPILQNLNGSILQLFSEDGVLKWTGFMVKVVWWN